MATDLRVLIIEDSERDTVLLLRKLKEAGYNVTHQRVDTDKDMKLALERQKWDIILSDYVMPDFSGLSALELLRQTGQDIPFIVVSGQIGEDVAVEAMRAGASDYLMKSNLKRLGSAIARELVEADNRRERRRTEKELARSEVELRKLSHRLIQMQEEERRSLARELHDEIGHTMVYLRLIIDRAQSSNCGDGESLPEAKDILTGLIDQVRNLSLSLKPPMLEEDGLLQALKYLIDRQARDSDIKIDLVSSDIPDNIAWEVNLAVYRIVQESITNIIKYAEASEVQVRLFSQDDIMNITITDNGVGFAIDNIHNGGSGIRGMKERVVILGGKFSIQSIPGSGTTVNALIPAKKAMPE